MIREYDIRGRVADGLDAHAAATLGGAFASYARQYSARTVGVAYDGRLSSPAIADSLCAALVDGGMAVTAFGLGPTPMLGHAVHARALAGGIMVTASHNPPDENGFKLSLGGEPVWGADLRTLVATPPAPTPGGSIAQADALPAYLEALLASAAVPTFKVAWDAGHGATAAVLPTLLPRLPGIHRLLNGTVDGHFPGHHPDPSVPANLAQLQAAVIEHGCDLGFAFDGDGDRLNAVDARGRIIWPDQLMLLLARAQLRRTPGAAIIADVKSARALFDGIAAAGGRAVLAPAGYVRIRAAMVRERAPLAGEMSGHIFIGDRWHGGDDGVAVALRVLAALGEERTSLDSLPATVATPEIRFACADADKARVLAAVAARVTTGEVNTVDGLRVTVPGGWWLLRASGTEAKLTARVEADDNPTLTRLLTDLRAHLAAAGVILPEASAA